MGYNPNQPRNMDGEWTSAGGPQRSKGNRSLADRIVNKHNADAALAVAKGAVLGVVQGVAAGAVAGAVTAGAPGAVVGGAIGGARGALHPALIAISASIGGYGALETHRQNLKSKIKEQHKKG